MKPAGAPEKYVLEAAIFMRNDVPSAGLIRLPFVGIKDGSRCDNVEYLSRTPKL